jgi:hypothetical protein
MGDRYLGLGTLTPLLRHCHTLWRLLTTRLVLWFGFCTTAIEDELKTTRWPLEVKRGESAFKDIVERHTINCVLAADLTVTKPIEVKKRESKTTLPGVQVCLDVPSETGRLKKQWYPGKIEGRSRRRRAAVAVATEAAHEKRTKTPDNCHGRSRELVKHPNRT